MSGPEDRRAHPKQYWPEGYELVPFVQAYTADGELWAQWDAGGDQTPIWLEVRHPDGQVTLVDYQAPDHDKLTRAIVRTLNLPNASDAYYHTGRAQVVLDEALFIRLRVTSRDYRLHEDYDWDAPANRGWRQPTGRLLKYEQHPWSNRPIDAGDGQHQIVVPLEGRHGVESVLHRATVSLVGEIDRDQTTRAEVNIDVINGDPVELDADTLAYYEEKITEVLIDVSDRFDHDPDLVGIYVEAPLGPGSEAVFEIITDSYDVLRLFDDEEVMLA